MFPRVWFLVVAVLLACASVQAGVKVVTTIQPLTLLVQPLLAEGDQLSQLLPANQSPHHIALSVSQRRALADAQLVIWVGPDLEAALAPLLESSEAALELSGLPGLRWPEGATQSHGDHHHGQDPHLWLNPANAGLVVGALADALAAQRPEQAAHYRAQSEALQRRLTDTDLAIRTRLAGSTRYISLHDAYGHWNLHFGTEQVAAVGTTPEQKPSARHLYQLQRLAPGAQCLVAEQLYANHNSETLAQQLRLPLLMADPLGQWANSYEALLLNLAQVFQACGR